MSEIAEGYKPGCKPNRDNDNCGVHLLSGIPNKVAVQIIKSLGWQETFNLFYRVMTARLRSNSNFKDYRDQMIDECRQSDLHPRCHLVEEAFKLVEL